MDDFTKEYYINQISLYSNRYGDKLLKLMDEYHKYNLRSITYQEAKEFYIRLINGEC